MRAQRGKTPQAKPMDMEFLHRPTLDAFLEWHSGTLVTPAGTYHLALEQKQEAVRFFVPSVFLLEFRPPDESSNQ